MYRMSIGGVELHFLPAAEGVSVEGGARPVTERVTLDGRVIATRAELPTSRRLTISAPEGYVISAADADALRALEAGGEPFSVTLAGYEPAGTFTGCVFDAPPRFPSTSDPRFRGYDLSIYIPQQ